MRRRLRNLNVSCVASSVRKHESAEVVSGKIPSCSFCQREGHDVKDCPKKPRNPRILCMVETEAVESTQTPLGNFIEGSGLVSTKDCEAGLVSVVHENDEVIDVYNMPALQGLLNQQPVSVLRDTGSNTVIVRRDLVKDSCLTGKTGKVFLVDGTSLQLPVAKTKLRSPYFDGELIVKCMDTPLYDVIVGNIQGARGVDEPDFEWKNKMVQQASQEPEKEDASIDTAATTDVSAASKLKSSNKKGRSKEMETQEVTTEVLKEYQRYDGTLENCRNKIGEIHHAKDGSTCSFYFSKGVLCRRYEQKGGKVFKQVVVPAALRT
ncbi:unnamed protein product [Ixodes pacificus]